MKLQNIILTFVLICCSLSLAYSQNAELDLLLGMDIERLLETKITTAAKFEQSVSEAVATVRVVTARDIKERGYQSLEDVLRDLPGFQFRNIQGFNSYIFQRGIPNQNNLMLVMIDGVLVNELNSGGFYAGSQYLLGNIEQVEIIYGPASALYGTNAVSGIVNLITKKAEDHPGLDISVGLGSYNTALAEARYAAYDKERQTGFSVAGRYFSTDKRPLGGAAGDNNWSNNIDNFERDFAVDLNASHKNLFLGFNLMNKKASRATNYKTTNSEFSDQGTLWNMLFSNAQIRWELKKENFSFLPKVYYRNSTLLPNSIAYADSITKTSYYRPGSLIGADFMTLLKIRENALITSGLVLERENLAEDFGMFSFPINGESEKAPKPPMKSYNLLGLYAQADVKLLKVFTVNAGLRFDNSSYYGDIFTPRLAFSYQINNFKTSILYNEAFRAPRPWDFTNGIGNPKLKPEEMQSVEWVTTFKIKESTLINLSLYQNNYKNLITIQNLLNDQWLWTNLGKVKTEGFEFEFNYIKSKINAWINYTFNFSVDDNDSRIPEISKQTANGGFNHLLFKNLNYGFRFNYAGARPNASLSLMPGSDEMRYPEIEPFFVLGFNISYTFYEQFQLKLIVDNMLNTRYYHTSNRPPDRYIQQGRTIFLQLNFHLTNTSR
ncbi:MAG: TonB-dependent receptor [Bacteroidales bacterium]|jgi:outer membrane cobalamin receptor|nr:TonB-dependent receptor [Bacteroidales bacterium]